MKKVLSFVLILALVLTCSVAAVPVSALELWDFEYKVNSDGTATITDYYGEVTELVIPSTLDGYKVTEIGSYAFRDCSSLTGITIPDGVEYIGDSTFSGCSSLTGITIPSSVTSIGDDAFCGCDKLTIYGEKDSAAESYAKMFGIAFVALGESAHGKVGDTNGDGKVTVADATQIQKHLANILKLEGAELEAADTNGDGKVTVADATQIQKYLAKVIPSLG